MGRVEELRDFALKGTVKFPTELELFTSDVLIRGDNVSISCTGGAETFAYVLYLLGGRGRLFLYEDNALIGVVELGEQFELYNLELNTKPHGSIEQSIEIELKPIEFVPEPEAFEFVLGVLKEAGYREQVVKVLGKVLGVED